MTIDVSNFEACLERIGKKGGALGREARQILEQVHERGEALRTTGAADPYVAAAGELADKAAIAARQAKLDALRNAQVRARVLGQIETTGGIKNAALTLRAILHGTNTLWRDSVESAWKGVSSGWQALLSRKLDAGGLEKAAISGALDRDIAREMWAMNAGETAAATANDPARRIAGILQPLLDHMRERLNAAGARIGDAKDYVTQTLHDPRKLRAAAGPGKTPDQAFAAWWKATEPKLAEKTFDDLEVKEGETAAAARQRFGRSVWDALVSGIHLQEGGALTEKGFLPNGRGAFIPAAFEGTGNLARKLSESRTLFWKDGESWHGYMTAFGRSNSLTEGVMMALDQGARKLALLDRLGTNPAANLNLVMRRIQETYRGDVDGVRAFQDKVPGLEAVMAHLDGSANLPANEMAARIAQNVRTGYTIFDLGGVGVTHFASIWPTVTSEMAHHGVSRLETLGRMAQALLRGKGPAERREILADLGAYAHGLTGDMRARWQAEDTIPGRISTLGNIFMKYTGIHYVFDNTQAAVRDMLAHQLGRNAGTAHEALDANLRQMLGKYGIGKPEWDLLRRVENLPTAEGRAYLTPSDAQRVDAAGAEAVARARGLLADDAKPAQIERVVGALRNELSDKLLAYYNDAAAHGVVTPGVRERAAVLGQDRPGGFGGELRRFLLQFKMWPLAAMNQMIGREIHMSLSRGQAAWNLGTLAALSMAGGYLRMSVNDVALGKPVRSPLDPATAFAALAQGGGVGILGDFLFGEVNRMGGGLVSTLGGPAVSDADSLVKLFTGWKQGKMGWPDLAHFAVRHIPFANLVYLKGALDYLLWYHLYEAASPGWWERTNRRLQKEQGRAMTGFVPGRGVPWTPFGLGGSQ